jgi:hypothetical protein
MVVNHSLQTPTSAELHDKDIGRWIVPLFIVFDILDNVGLVFVLVVSHTALQLERGLAAEPERTWLRFLRILASFRKCLTASGEDFPAYTAPFQTSRTL